MSMAFNFRRLFETHSCTHFRFVAIVVVESMLRKREEEWKLVANWVSNTKRMRRKKNVKICCTYSACICMTLVWYLVQSVCQPYTMPLHPTLTLYALLMRVPFLWHFCFSFRWRLWFLHWLHPNCENKVFFVVLGRTVWIVISSDLAKITLVKTLPNGVKAQWVRSTFTLYSLGTFGARDPERGRRKWYLTLRFPQFQNLLFSF